MAKATSSQQPLAGFSQQFAHWTVPNLDLKRFGNTFEGRVMKPKNVVIQRPPDFGAIAMMNAVDLLDLSDPSRASHNLSGVGVQALSIERMTVMHFIIW